MVAITLALPLAFEAPEPDLMTRPPRAPDAPLLSGFLVARTCLVAVLMTASAISLFFYEYLTVYSNAGSVPVEIVDMDGNRVDRVLAARRPPASEEGAGRGS